MLFSPVASPQQMHIPDGFLSIPVSIIFWIISILAIGLALRKIRDDQNEQEVPLMGVMAAAIFAGQMLNFSITGGTSGHLLGAALAVILLGPWRAVLVMTTVVSVQAILFQDGGILALGANIFNMAVVGVFVSYAVFSLLRSWFKRFSWGLSAAGFTAAWASIFIASLACGLQLSLSGTLPANIAIPAMGLIHALIGVGEGLITVGALNFIRASRKDLLTREGEPIPLHKGLVFGGLSTAALLVFLSPLASKHPDGLEWVAEQNGFLAAATESFYRILPDYSIPGMNNPTISTVAAGLIGIVVVFLVVKSVGRTQDDENLD